MMLYHFTKQEDFGVIGYQNVDVYYSVKHGGTYIEKVTLDCGTEGTLDITDYITCSIKNEEAYCDEARADYAERKAAEAEAYLDMKREERLLSLQEAA